MSLQWLSAAAFLYTEIGLGFLLCLGFISNSRWQRIFSSRLLTLVKQYGNFYFSAFVLIMFVLFLDSLNGMRKYSNVDSSHNDLRNNPQSEVQAHMKLFRAQRNLYISGFSLFMLIVLRRLVTLISTQATLEASYEAVLKQAKGASEQASKLIDENDKLRKENRTSAAEESEEEEKKIKKQVSQLMDEVNEKNQEIEKLTKDLEAMKAQSEGLHREYDRVLDEHNILEKKLAAKSTGAEGNEEKKDS